MATSGGNDGGLQAGGATADHRHLLRSRRPLQGADAVNLLPPGGGGFDTTEPAVQPHPADAFLIARQTQPNVFALVLACLAGEFGIGDLRPDNANQIGVTFRQDAFGLDRVLDAPHADHRQAHRLADRRRDEHRVVGRDAHRRFDHVERLSGGADAGIDAVDLPVALKNARQIHSFLNGNAIPDQLVAAEADTQHIVAADRETDGADDLAQEPRPVLQAATILVGALICAARQKLADNRGMRTLQLNAIEPAPFRIAGDRRVAVDDLMDVFVFHRLRHFSEQRVGDRRWRPGRQAGEHAAALATVVVDLGQNRNALGVHHLGDSPVCGDHGRIESVDQLLVRMVGGVDGVLLGDDQTHPAARPLAIVVSMTIGRHVVFGIVGQVRGKHDAVLHRDVAHLERGEQEARRPAHLKPPVRRDSPRGSPGSCIAARGNRRRERRARPLA